MHLSIVIVNYNTRDLLRDCLNSLEKQNGLQFEVIVIDNASVDGSAAMVREHFPNVRLLEQTRNQWFCGGNNIGIEAALGRYVLLLNPDTVVTDGALAQMVTFMDTHPDYAGVTAQMRYPDGTIQRTCSRVPTYRYLLLNHTPLGWLLPQVKRRLAARHWYAEWDRTTDKDIEVMPGSCTLMRREDIKLDDQLLLYFPEDDLSRRINGKRRFLASAVIMHYEKAATQSWLATRVYFQDMLHYVRVHHGITAALLLWLLSRPLLWGMWLKRALMHQ